MAQAVKVEAKRADEVYHKTARAVRAVYPSLPDDEKSVLDLLVRFWPQAVPLTQQAIARELPNLGPHFKHDKRARNIDSTLRQIRQLIRNLRVEYLIPVCSSEEGYFLPLTKQDAEEYLQRLEREARARAASSFETYRAVSRALDLRSTLFDALERGESDNGNKGETASRQEPVKSVSSTLNTGTDLD